MKFSPFFLSFVFLCLATSPAWTQPLTFDPANPPTSVTPPTVEYNEFTGAFSHQKGPKTILVVLVVPNDRTGWSNPPTFANLNTQLNDTSQVYYNASYRQVWFGPKRKNGTTIERLVVTPVLTMPQPASFYNSDTFYDLYLHCVSAVRSQGGVWNGGAKDPNNFDRIVVMMGNHKPIGSTGLAYVGWTFSYLGDELNSNVALHELGHNWGVYHANYWRSNTADARSTNGSHSEYGDGGDIMGGGTTMFNTMMKEDLGFLEISRNEVRVVSTSGTYRLYDHVDAHSRNATSLQRSLLLPVTGSGTGHKRMFLSYRHEFGTDGGENRDSRDRHAVQVHAEATSPNPTDNDSSHFLDTTPGSRTDDDKIDGSIKIGRTWAEGGSVNGTSILGGTYVTPILKGSTVGPGGQTHQWIDVVVNTGNSVPGNNQAPTALFSSSIIAATTGSPVALAVTANDPDGDVLAYNWDFGNGTYNITNSPNQTPTYAAPGFYLVNCTVSDMKGRTVVASAWVNVGNQTFHDPVAVTTTAGLHYRSYSGTWTALPTFDRLQPVTSGTSTGFDLSVKPSADNFALLYTGYLDVPAEDVYQFEVQCEDGASLLISGQAVVSNDGEKASPSTKTGKIALKAGKHPLRLEFFHKTGTETLVVKWWRVGQTLAPIPSANLLQNAWSGNSAPTVTITSPAAGGKILANSDALVTASASDDGLISKVVFFADGTFLEEDFTAPYAAVWPNVALGSHTFDAIAYDSTGRWAPAATVNFTSATNQAPNASAALLAPIPSGQHQGTLVGTASDDDLPAPFTVNWSKQSGPGTVTITNPTAQQTAVSFDQSGTYLLRFSVNDGLATSSSDLEVTINLNPAVATRIAVSPNGLNILPNAQRTFVATLYDQYDRVMSSPSYAWSVTGGGSISSTGVFTANSTETGPHTVSATSGALVGTANFSVANDVPTLSTIADVTSSVGASIPPILFSINDTETSPSSLVVSASSDNQSLLTNSGLLLGGSGSARTLAITPVPGQHGTANVTVQVSDGQKTAQRVFAVTIEPPVATDIVLSPETATLLFNESLTFNAIVRDQAGLPLSPQPTITWSTTGGGVIDNIGRFTAGGTAGGPFTVTASSSTLSDTATVSVLSPVLAPSADTHVRSGTVSSTVYSAQNFGADPTLVLKKDSAGYERQTFLKFDTTGISGGVTAKVRLFIPTASTDRTPVSVAIHAVALTNWAEGSGTISVPLTSSSGMTWDTMPLIGAKIVSTTVTNNTNSWYEWDVTSYVTSEKAAGRNVLAFALQNETTTATNQLYIFNSKEAPTNKPQLVFSGAPTASIAAAASANPVTGTSANLSVLGADDAGEAALTYTWATTGTPPAGVTFSSNGSNASKNTLVTFTQAGVYNFLVTIRDAENLTTTSGLSVSVVPTLAALTVTPASATVLPGSTRSFTATGTDQFGQPMTPTASWSVTGGGTISSEGLFTAAASESGPHTVTAVSGGFSATGSVSVLNTSPTMSAISDRTYSTIAPIPLIQFTVGDSETPETLVVAAYSNNQTLMPNSGLLLGGSGLNRSLQLAPTSGQTGSALVTVEVSDGQKIATSTFTLSIETSVASTLTVAPNAFTLPFTATKTFVAEVRDQSGALVIPQPSIGWNVTGGGTISPSGLFTAGSVAGGPHTITASAGALSGTASVTVISPILRATGDTFVRGTIPGGTDYSGQNYGGDPSLILKKDLPGYERRAFLKFDTTGVTGVTTAKVRLFLPNSGADTTSIAISIYPVATTSWNEGAGTVGSPLTSASGMTWATMPTVGTTKIASTNVANNSNSWYEWDVTSYVLSEQAAGRNVVAFSLQNDTTTTQLFTFSSDETGTSANRPQLALTWAATNAAPTVATAAAASSNPVTGTSTTLNVLGADDAGEAALTYTWATVGTPPAAVNFSTNGTNAAKNSLATFSTAGLYHFTVTIRDAENLSVTSSVAVTVNQTLTNITVTPSNLTVVEGSTQAYAAACLDQFGQAMSSSILWSVNGGGMINSGGVFSATTPGTGFLVTASSGATTGTATVNVTGAYENWISAFPGLTGNATLPNEDPDQDGASNLLEFALGGNPDDSNPAILPVLDTTSLSGSTYLTLTLSKNPAASSLAYVVETSSDLVNWSSGGSATTTMTETSTTIIVRDTTPLSSGTRRFLRLRVVNE